MEAPRPTRAARSRSSAKGTRSSCARTGSSRRIGAVGREGPPSGGSFAFPDDQGIQHASRAFQSCRHPWHRSSKRRRERRRKGRVTKRGKRLRRISSNISSCTAARSACARHTITIPRGSRAKNRVGKLDNCSNLPFPLHLTGPIRSNYLFASRAQARRQLLSVARMRPLLPDIALVKISRPRG